MSTYEPIASQTLGSAASSVTFSSIPQGYTDLVLVLNVKGSTANFPSLRFNGDSGSNYSRTILTGNGSAASSARGNNESAANINYNAQTSSSEFNYNSITHIQNYSNSTTYKTQLTRANQAALGTDAIATLWRNTAAITEITAIMNTGNYAAGSTFTIYGIQVGDKVQKAQGGNIVTSDGTYVYHAFTSSGSFIPNQALTADILVVGGGGGGASYIGGGGGAGQVRAFSSQSLTTKSYTCLVAAGGAGARASSNITDGSNGSLSKFASLSEAIGGGYGSTVNGGTGASCGGGGGYPNGTYVGGTGTAGFNGGNGSSDNATWTNTGGGGGAGAAGGNSTVSTTGAGGAGVNTVTNWGALSSVLTSTGLGVSGYIGGGGSGGGQSGSAGAAGSGGGGQGVVGSGNPTSGISSTGSGGGGAGNVSNINPGGNGGSGIIVIRYLA